MIIPNEIASVLEAEVAAIVDVLLEFFSDPETLEDANTVAAGLGRYIGHVEQIGIVAEQGGLQGFSQVCSQLSQRLMLLEEGEKAFADAHRELLEEWPALIMGYMEQADSVASEGLVNYLQNPAWPESLFEIDFAELQEQLVNVPVRYAQDSSADFEEVVAGASEVAVEVEQAQASFEAVEVEATAAVVEQAQTPDIVQSSEVVRESENEGPVHASVSPVEAFEIRRFPHVSNLEASGVQANSMEIVSAPLAEQEAIKSTASELMSLAQVSEDFTGTPVVESYTDVDQASPPESIEEALKLTPPRVVASVDSPSVESLSEAAAMDEAYSSEDLEFEAPLEHVTYELAQPEAALVTDEVVELHDAVGTAPTSEPEGETQSALGSSNAGVSEPQLVLAPAIEADAPDQEALTTHVAEDTTQSLAVAGLEVADANRESAEEFIEAEEIEDREMEEEDQADITADDNAALLPGFDQELVELLQSEVSLIAEATDEIQTIGLSVDADTEARIETMTAYAEQIARLADAADALGLSGLQQACIHWSDNVMALASGFRPLTPEESELLTVMPAMAARYLEKLPDRHASQALIEQLQKADWPNPLPMDAADALVNLLAAPTFAVPEEMAVEARPREALPEHVSLRLPEDVNSELLDSLLQELPGQAAELSVAIQRLASGDGVLRDVEVAQRIAHTVKGAGNTVGVRGIANLTHHMEDILQAFSKHQALPGRRLADTLLSAADCLESMSESLVGLGDPPPQAQEVLQNILDWANQIDQEGLPQDDAAPVREFTPKSPATTLPLLEDMAGATEAGDVGEATAGVTGLQAAVPMLRVPATLVDDLLRLVGESIILTGQVQERARKALRQIRAVQTQHQVFQQLTADLEQLVEIRGIAPLPGQQVTGVGNFDPLELEQYNELNTVTHRLLEASADSRALGQDIREDLSALDDLLVTQGRLHRESQEAVLRTRMVQVKTIVPRLQRSVRQTCRLTDKEVQFVVTGGDTWMDSQLLADITDPLMHVLRNAIDHGIEPAAQRQAAGKNPVGRITLSFVREGQTMVVRCRDDGAGLDFNAIRTTARERGLIAPDAMPGETELTQLILSSGFSTRSEVTQTSGRGIGLDAVYSALRELKGSFQIRSTAGQGCLMEFRLPVTLIAIHALLVGVHEQRFAISSRGVEQVLYSALGEIRQLGTKKVYQLKDDFYPLTSLETILQLSHDRRAAQRHIPALLLVQDGAGVTHAVVAEQVLDSRDLVVKPLGRYFPKLPGIVGATILGDGSVVPVIDLPELLNAPLSESHAITTSQVPKPAVQSTRVSRKLALVVDDSLSARRALAQAVEDAGLEVRTARDGLEAVTMIEGRRPDLLLVDLEMPRMNGLELTAHVRAREATRNLPVIMVTSRSTAKHRHEAEAAGVNFYMTKPFTDDDLLENINSALHNAGVGVS